MSADRVRTEWHIVDAQWVDEDPDVSVIAVTVRSNGKEYVVVCSGPKGMKSDEFVPAITAASHALSAASGNTASVVDPKDDMFDTGNQRAS
jgi:hypothetical protein